MLHSTTSALLCGWCVVSVSLEGASLSVVASSGDEMGYFEYHGVCHRADRVMRCFDTCTSTSVIEMIILPCMCDHVACNRHPSCPRQTVRNLLYKLADCGLTVPLTSQKPTSRWFLYSALNFVVTYTPRTPCQASRGKVERCIYPQSHPTIPMLQDPIAKQPTQALTPPYFSSSFSSPSHHRLPPSSASTPQSHPPPRS